MPVFGRGYIGRKRYEFETRLTRLNRKRIFQKRKTYGFESTPLALVEDRLRFNISNFIEDTSMELKRPIVVLDWGCGKGAALRGLARKFNDKVRLYGFSADSYKEWGPENSANLQIAFIQETAENSHRYFKPNSVDLIFSRLGLVKVKYEKYFFQLLAQLSSKLSTNGMLVTGMGTMHSGEFDYYEKNIREEATKLGLNLQIKLRPGCLEITRID